MKFKSPHLRDEFFKVHPITRLMAVTFEQLSLTHFNKDPVITRIFEDIKGATGVHPAGRAIDIRDQHAGVFMYTEEEKNFLVSEINKRFPGNDKFKSCIHHSFGGGPFHFHLQVSSGDKYDKDMDCYVVV